MTELQALLDADKTLFEDFVNYAARHGVKPVRSEIARSRRIMEAQLRAYIGRNTALEDNGFYYNIYPIDDVLRRSVEVLQQMSMPEPEPEEEMISRELPEMVIKIKK
jgi:carboxyl-terminal processing protease